MENLFGNMGKTIIFLGIILVIIGMVIYFFDKIPYIGKLPGDIVIKRDNFTFYFPLATSIIVSVVLSLIFYLVSKIGG